MNDELENKELAELLKQIPAPERLDAARREKILAALPSEAEDAQRTERETRRRIWYGLVKYAALFMVIGGVLAGLLFPAGKGALSKARKTTAMHASAETTDSSVWTTSGAYAYDDGSPKEETPLLASACLDFSEVGADTPASGKEVGGRESELGGPGFVAGTTVRLKDEDRERWEKKLESQGFELPADAESPPLTLSAAASAPATAPPAKAMRGYDREGRNGDVVDTRPTGGVRNRLRDNGWVDQAQKTDALKRQDEVAYEEVAMKEENSVVDAPMETVKAQAYGGRVAKQKAAEAFKRDSGELSKVVALEKHAEDAQKADVSYKLGEEQRPEQRLRRAENTPADRYESILKRAPFGDGRAMQQMQLAESIEVEKEERVQYDAIGGVAVDLKAGDTLVAKAETDNREVLKPMQEQLASASVISELNGDVESREKGVMVAVASKEVAWQEVAADKAEKVEEVQEVADALFEKAAEPEVEEKPLVVDFGPFTLIPTTEHPLSTFGLDTDTAGYTRSAVMIEQGVRPRAEMIRQEEFINAFDYGDEAPTESAFRIYIEGARSPFRSANNLLRVGVKGRRLGREEKRSLVLTILLDSSGSMETAERMPLARKAILALLATLPDGDAVTVLTCSDRTRKLFSASAWENPETFQSAKNQLNEIRCQGATNLEDGIVKAFESASSEFNPHGENRVVIISDGIANLGSKNAEEILKKVSANRERGIRCSVIGVGRSSYNDTLLEAMANRGDGQYSFLDSEKSIDESFVSDLENSFNTIASDVKIQVEWNAAAVDAYKSHGYDSRVLRDEQFRDDTVDAGEVGSGQGVTVVYEAKLAETAAATSVLGTVRIRYRRTDNGEVEEIEKAITAADVMGEFRSARPQFRLACAVAEFATVLKHTPAMAQGAALRDVSSIADRVALELGYYTPANAFAEIVKKLTEIGL